MHGFLLAVYNWFTDRRIQFSILIVLTITLIVTVILEIPKIRKRVKFLSVKVENSASTFSYAVVDFSNNCRRIIRPRDISSITYSGGESRNEVYNWPDLEEGDDFRVYLYYTDVVGKDDIKQIVVTDSVGKKYAAYLYKGEIRNWWVIKALQLRDKWL